LKENLAINSVLGCKVENRLSVENCVFKVLIENKIGQKNDPFAPNLEEEIKQ